MNSPALHSFSGPKLGNRTPVSVERNKELESRLGEMQIWKERCLFLDGKKEISQWMDFDIAEYTDIIFAIQMGDIHIDYNEQSFDNTMNKSLFSEQRKNSLDEMKKFVNELQNAKTYWHTHFESTLRLLNETINITEMIRISPAHTVTHETQQSNYNYEILRKQCTNLFAAADILIQTNKNLSSLGLDTIANLCNIRIFKNNKISTSALNAFYRAEEVRLLLHEKPGEVKESFITQYQHSVDQLKEKTRDPKGMDSLERDTNLLICQVLSSKYMEVIAKQSDLVSEIIKKYEIKCWKYTDIFKVLQKEIDAIDSSRDLLQVFVAIERITGKYSKNIRVLATAYDNIKGLNDTEDMIRKLNLLYARIRDGLMENIRYNYQSNPSFALNPEVSVKEAIRQTHADMGIFKTLHYALLKLLDRKVFDEEMMIQMLAYRKKTPSVKGQNYKASLHSSAEEKLSEYRKGPFYTEMVKALESAVIIYVKKVEHFIGTFSDPSWKNGKEKEKETIGHLFESTKKRIAEKKV